MSVEVVPHTKETWMAQLAAAGIADDDGLLIVLDKLTAFGGNKLGEYFMNLLLVEHFGPQQSLSQRAMVSAAKVLMEQYAVILPEVVRKFGGTHTVAELADATHDAVTSPAALGIAAPVLAPPLPRGAKRAKRIAAANAPLPAFLINSKVARKLAEKYAKGSIQWMTLCAMALHPLTAHYGAKIEKKSNIKLQFNKTQSAFSSR